MATNESGTCKIKYPLWIFRFLFITRIHSDFLLSKQLGQWTKMLAFHLAVVHFVYRFPLCRDADCGVYDRLEVLHI